MSTLIRDAYLNALLAQASYVNGLAPGQALGDQLTQELTATAAEYVGSQFTVVTQHTDPVSGFSVTVFADSGGTQYISFRGTEFTSAIDWLVDFDAYFLSGLGRSQVIAMVNWYMRASTPSSEQAVQILEAPLVDELTGEVQTTSTAQGEQTLPVAGSYVVNGHSLGGT